MIDNLGGRLGSFDRIEKELAPGACWSGFDRAIGGSAFFGERAAANDRTDDAERPRRGEPTPEPAPLAAELAEPAVPAAEVGAQIALTDEPAREAA
jgi:hypothetical protein